MPANTNNATYVGLMLMSQVNLWLNEGAKFSWFAGAHVPFAPYGIDWVTYPIASSISLTDASDDIEVKAKRAGDRFRQVILEIVHPVLVTYSAAAIDKDGGTDSGSSGVKFLVDDLTTAGNALSKLSALASDDSSTAGIAASVMLLSQAMSNMADATPTLASSNKFTKPTAAGAKHVSQYFPLIDCCAHFADYAPAIVLNAADWNVSTGVVDTVTGFHCVCFCEFWQALGAGMEAKYLHHSKDHGDLVAWSCMSEGSWFLPLPFYYTHSAAQSLPARGLHNHPLSWTFKFNPAGWAIVGGPSTGNVLTSFPTNTAGDSTWTLGTVANGVLNKGLSPLFAASASSASVAFTALTDAMFKANLHVEVIYVTPQERNTIHYSSGEDVIVCHKDLTKKSFTNSELTGGSEITHYTTPKLVVQAFQMAVQRGSMVAQNKRMDFSGVHSPYYRPNGNVQSVQPILSKIDMSMNDDLKFSYTMDDFRLHAYTYAEKTDVLDGLMLYSLTIGNPYALQKKGGIAFAKVDDTTFTFTPNENACTDHTAEGGIALETATWQATTLQVNIFGRGKGMGGKKWS